MKIAIIGGSGLSSFPWPARLETVEVETPYGKVGLQKGCWLERDFFFLPRHGQGHTVPPHLINYCANIYGLAQLGVEWVLATAAVGSLRKNIPPGSLVLLNQFIDYTKARTFTFFNGGDAGLRHTDFTNPYCETLRRVILKTAAQKGIRVRKNGCYVCTEGPRYETAAEVKMFARLGGDVVGMTNVPEVTLARELGLCYAALAVVTNYGAGITKKFLTHSEVEKTMNENMAKIGRIFAGVLEAGELKEKCGVCPRS